MRSSRISVSLSAGVAVVAAIFAAALIWLLLSDPVSVADAVNEKVHILRRDSLQVLRAFGDGGHYPGQFYGVHNLAVDSKGNIYTAEVAPGRRFQRFVFKGRF